MPLTHVDLYRLEPSETEALGLEEAVERGALVVEWGERLPARWRGEALTIELAITGEEARELTASARTGRGLALLGAWCGRPPGSPA
jgi:tRNA A37 threonylcarbamoyladenosine biosynthesis protein TsaE